MSYCCIIYTVLFWWKTKWENGWMCLTNPWAISLMCNIGFNMTSFAERLCIPFSTFQIDNYGETSVLLSKSLDCGLNGIISEMLPHFLPTIWCVSHPKRNGFDLFLSPSCRQEFHKRVYTLNLNLKLVTDYTVSRGLELADQAIFSLCADPTVAVLTKGIWNRKT